jgi:NADH:ubiquinone oxidoreductase subunit C
LYFISLNYKIYFKYLYFNLPHLYLQQSKKGYQNTSVLLLKDFFYFTCIHLRFSSIFYSNQLVDLFSYELPLRSSKTPSSLHLNKKYSESYLVYNFHNITYQDRLFFFCINSTNPQNSEVNSIAELFPNASWLEREVSELNGVIFNNKKDLRNLMLQYGDTSVPFQKSSPSIGYKEFYYDSVNDVLIETPITLQV